jgi:signal transduction histidine kinase
MSENGRDPQSETVAEAIRQVDAERRTWRFSLQLTIANVAFGLAPLVPRSEAIFGSLTASQALAMIVPGQVGVYTSVWLYRRGGSERRAYRVSEAVETFLLYMSTLGIIFASGVRWSPVWSLPPFTAIFWGQTKPFHRRLYHSIIGIGHVLMALAFLLRGDVGGALIAVGMGVASALIFEGTARPARDRILAEADRNQARARVNEGMLEAERERIARSLTAGIADRLSGLLERLGATGAVTGEVRAKAAEQVRHALVELRAIAHGQSEAAVPRTLEGLAELVERKVRPLCVEARYEQTLRGEPAATLGASTALAALRILQELVRNAITHGAARAIGVELAHEGGQLTLSVEDDGKGLGSERMTSATGGLRNAQRWSSELGGSFHRFPSPGSTGTALRVILPADRA